jgi:hypothetical protein
MIREFVVRSRRNLKKLRKINDLGENSMAIEMITLRWLGANNRRFDDKRRYRSGSTAHPRSSSSAKEPAIADV